MSDIIKSDELARLQASIDKATEAATRLLKCAESISNPVYSVSMHGHRGELKILAVRHFQGQICITVEDANTLDSRQHAALENAQGQKVAREALRPVARVLGHPRSIQKCSTLYGSDAEGDCALCGYSKADHDGGF